MTSEGDRENTSSLCCTASTQSLIRRDVMPLRVTTSSEHVIVIDTSHVVSHSSSNQQRSSLRSATTDDVAWSPDAAERQLQHRFNVN